MEAHPNQPSQAMHALHLAVIRNDLQMIEHLIQTGTDINVTNDNGTTALHVSAQVIQPDAMKLLIDLGADINAQTFKTLETPLIKSIICWRRDPETKAIDRSPSYFLLAQGANPNLGDYKNRTALHYASAYNSIELVQKLLEFGADPSISSRGFGTPIDVALKYNNIGVATAIRNFNHENIKSYPHTSMFTKKHPRQHRPTIQKALPARVIPRTIQKPIKPIDFGI